MKLSLRNILAHRDVYAKFRRAAGRASGDVRPANEMRSIC